jgi:hypothetical protein
MSTIKVSNLQNASAASPAIVLDANSRATLNGLSYPTEGSLSGRNRIINGDMRIDQRNAGASVTPAAGAAPSFAVDRFSCSASQNSKCTVQQNAGSVTPPAGFSHYYGFTSTSAYTIGASDFFGIQHKIEGFNFSDLAFGTASAKQFTLSFWVRSSLTGTFAVNFQNGGQTRSYGATYSISAANTWEQKTITISGDTNGTWAVDNTTGLNITFGVGIGSTYSISSGSWQTTTSPNGFGTTGATSVVATNGATFYITGVQLEAGSVATPFERRSYGAELSLCQRYYEKSYNQSVVPGTATDVGMWCAVGSNTASCGGLTWKVPKRAAPTVVLYSSDGTAGAVDKLASGTKVTGATATDIGENSFRYVAVTTTTESHKYQYALSAEL